MIKPTVGRVIWVRNRDGGNRSQPEVALICYVHNDMLINVAGFDCNGEPFALSSLPLKQLEDSIPPNSTYAEWMPYQQGQAAKTEALEKQLASQS